MNMQITNQNFKNTYAPQFKAKYIKPEIKLINLNECDTVELVSALPDILPKKFELSPLEILFNDVLMRFRMLNHNIYTQKCNLKQFYSAQDKYDYQQLLKERKSLSGKMKRIAKKGNLTEDFLSLDISIKKEYNRYAPKIFRATTLQELIELQKMIKTLQLYQRTNELLTNLIEQRKSTLSK